MKNLAGVIECDRTIMEELRRSMIPSVPYDGKLGEVPSRLRGILGPFVFWRAWYYWVVKGPMPLAIAQELYEDPVGRADVRVNGFAGGIVPDAKAAKWFMDDGTQVAATKDQSEYEKFRDRYPNIDWERYVWHDDPALIGAMPYIASYHIDSEVGLRLFCDTVRKHGLAKATRPSWWRNRD